MSVCVSEWVYMCGGEGGEGMYKSYGLITMFPKHIILLYRVSTEMYTVYKLLLKQLWWFHSVILYMYMHVHCSFMHASMKCSASKYMSCMYPT